VSLLEQTSGTLVNVVAVLLGAGAGLLLRRRLPARVVATVVQALGLTVVLVGVINALDLTRVTDPPGLIVGLTALAAGAALGEWWRLDDALERLGERLKERFGGQGAFTQGFVSASLLFCVGPLTLIGSIQNGLSGDNDFLLLKSALDGIAALALAASFGFGVLFSAATILVYQGALSLGAGLFATLVPDPATDPRVLLINGVGGLMILGLGLDLLEVRRLRVAAMLPALIVVVAFYHVALLFYR
jgi:uncharacterized membrane protein YqgA involved in biofilm formation